MSEGSLGRNWIHPSALISCGADCKDGTSAISMNDMEKKPQEAVIQLENLQFCWTKTGPQILDIPVFEIQKQERVFIRGASGSGKTTLLGLIGGVLTEQAGEVKVLGTSLNQLSPRTRDAFRVSHIGFIFQMFNLIPYLSVTENVLLPCQFSKERRKKALAQSASLEQEAVRLLATLGLNQSELLSRSVAELSIGQQQRVAAARALIGRPDILIADEPTSSLDADARESFLQLLFEECRVAQTTIIFVSHDQSLAALFDRTVSMTEISRTDPMKTQVA